MVDETAKVETAEEVVQEPVMVPKLVNVVVTSDLGTGRVRIVFDKDVQFVEFGHDQARTFITETKAHTRRAAGTIERGQQEVSTVVGVTFVPAPQLEAEECPKPPTTV